MMSVLSTTSHRRRFPWRAVLWGAALLLLALPWVAMRFTPAVRWDLGDFVVFGAMLGIAGGAMEGIARLATDGLSRWFALGGIVLGFLAVWAEMAVGLGWR